MVRCVQERGIPFLITFHDYWWVCANAQLITNYSGEPCEGPRAFLNCARCALARAGQSAAAPLPLDRLWPAVPAVALLMAWRRRQLRSVLGQAQRLIAPSQFVWDWYASHGVPVDRLHLLPHGLAWPLNLVRKRERATALRLAYIGGLSWQKGVHVLLDALDGVRGQVELSTAGDESFDPRYVARLKAKARPNVRFLGLLSHQGVWELLSQTDVVVIPSLWNETFSLIAHEAFAAGVPVVASRAGALSDAVHDGQDGLLVSPGDVTAWREALQRMVDQPDLIAKLRANVEPPLTLAEHAERIERLYLECCPV
jgi:glycosyltransferase involved in cell wall biosynthesis